MSLTAPLDKRVQQKELTREPILHRGKVGAWWSLPILERLDRSSRAHHDAQAGRTSNAFLARRQDNV